MMHYCSTKRLNGKEQHCTEKKKKRKTIKNREDDIIVKKKNHKTLERYTYLLPILQRSPNQDRMNT